MIIESIESFGAECRYIRERRVENSLLVAKWIKTEEHECAERERDEEHGMGRMITRRLPGRSLLKWRARVEWARR